MKLFKSLIREEKGQGLVEYALIIALIAIVVIGAVKALGGSINTIFGNIKDGLESK
jgi:pilus assembly protein Flp/PilA